MKYDIQADTLAATPTLTDWQFHTTPPSAWEGMLADLQTAQHSIAIEHYLVRANRIGADIFQTLCDKARQGVRVRMVADAFGSAPLYLSRWPQRLREAGGEFAFYNPPWAMRHVGRLLPRTHRKLLVVDERVAWMGGVCLDQKMEGWRDTAVRITGPLVAECLWPFNQIWAEIHGDTVQEQMPPFRTVPESTIVTSEPGFRRNAFFGLLEQRLLAAKREVCLTSPYFVVHRRFLALLCWLAKQGIRVRVVISDRAHPTLRALAMTKAGMLLDAGVEMGLYQQTMIHAKVAIVDREWAAFGSSNLDYLSIFANHEANLITVDPVAVDMLQAQFETDCCVCEHYSKESWMQRPVWQKVVGHTLRPFRGIL